MEIGSLYGYSAILMANVVSSDDEDERNNDVNIKVVSIEIDKNNSNIAKRNIQEAAFQIK